MWGWGSWRRVWKNYDPKMSVYPELKKKGYFSDLFPNKYERKYIEHIMDVAYNKNPNAVDVRWLLSSIINNGLTVVPNKNLVNNIGFGSCATHTKKSDSFLSFLPQKIEFPLKHPPFIIRDRVADERYTKWLFWNRLKKQILSKTGLNRILGK